MRRILKLFQRETVLCVSFILAAVSMFLVPPDAQYRDYIDFRTLAVLFCLMSVMAGFREDGAFGWIARKFLGHVKSGRGLILTLVLLCFFSSMLITNDVALITFVPFTFIILGMLGESRRERLALPVVVMQTIAANLGSMLTPVGNPQNLYLYGKAGLSMAEFLLLMLPYTLLSLGMLVAWSLVQGRACPEISGAGAESIQEEAPREKKTVFRIAVYCGLFALCLLTVARLLPWQAVLAVVAAAVFVMDRRVYARVDYSLLLTFAGFFIFVGNVGRVPVFRDFLQDMIAGREVYTAVLASQVISNVPAALLLSGFTEDIGGLVVGTNLGGLGTLIASMASLISYKYVAKEAAGCKGKYILLFTVGNVLFLAALVLMHILLGGLG